MANEKYKPQVPDIMESIFDAGYLIFDLIKTFPICRTIEVRQTD